MRNLEELESEIEKLRGRLNESYGNDEFGDSYKISIELDRLLEEYLDYKDEKKI